MNPCRSVLADRPGAEDYRARSTGRDSVEEGLFFTGVADRWYEYAVSAALEEMALVEGGRFRMGAADFYPEERPVRDVHVDGFWIDRQPVTVAQFRRFVKDTGYVTRAEQPLQLPTTRRRHPSLLVPGSLVFHPTPGPVSLDNNGAWWHYLPGAMWARPEGPASESSRGRGIPSCTSRTNRHSTALHRQRQAWVRAARRFRAKAGRGPQRGREAQRADLTAPQGDPWVAASDIANSG